MLGSLSRNRTEQRSCKSSPGIRGAQIQGWNPGSVEVNGNSPICFNGHLISPRSPNRVRSRLQSSDPNLEVKFPKFQCDQVWGRPTSTQNQTGTFASWKALVITILELLDSGVPRAPGDIAPSRAPGSIILSLTPWNICGQITSAPIGIHVTAFPPPLP